MRRPSGLTGKAILITKPSLNRLSPSYARFYNHANLPNQTEWMKLVGSEPKQLPFDLPFEAAMGRDDFLVGDSNQAAFDLIEQWPDWPSRLVILAGPTGAGKSHLAGIWSNKSGARTVSGDAIDGIDPVELTSGGAVLVEDADNAGRDDTGLFHLLNAARAADAFLLITCRSWPSSWGIDLPDLLSRLRAATPVEIGEPDDDLLRRVLVKLFADRQVSIAPPVVDYLAVRMERSLAAAAALVDELDREALSKGKAVTRPIAAEVLKRDGIRHAPVIDKSE